MKKRLLSGLNLFITTGIICSFFLFQSCKKNRSDIGEIVFKETKNKVFKDIPDEKMATFLKKVLNAKQEQLRNPKLITSFYEQNGYEPVLIKRYLPDGQLKGLTNYLAKAGNHGLAASMFDAKLFSSLINRVYDKSKVADIEDACQTLAEMEIAAANSLTSYSNAIVFGAISPKRIYANYYTQTSRPQDNDMLKLFELDNLSEYLDSIQPKDKSYLALQKALNEGVIAPGMSKEETSRQLAVNMERMRWKVEKGEGKSVWVNIPDYRLDVMEKGTSLLNMKVCVGEGRDLKKTVDLKEYDEQDLKKDRPFSRETPQLSSMIYSVQVNPVWNIPESIATKEISRHASADRYYLSNNNIDVYENGKLIKDSETIDWSNGSAGGKYTFKQRPGEENSLGKIKFLFKNQSSVYLHDTPAKAAFDKPDRALSHGCIRLEKPLELAQQLFGEGEKFQLIKKEMALTANQKAKDIALPVKIPVHLTYFTCWADELGGLQFRKDIYGLDVVLYSYLMKLGQG